MRMLGRPTQSQSLERQMDLEMRTHHLEYWVLRLGRLDRPCGRAAGRCTLHVRFRHGLVLAVMGAESCCARETFEPGRRRLRKSPERARPVTGVC